MKRLKLTEIVPMMGDKVVVSEMYSKRTSLSGTDWLRIPIPLRAGWIVGVKYLQIGEVVYSAIERDSFRQTCKPIQALLVCFYPGENPIPVSPAGIRRWVDGDPEPRRSCNDTDTAKAQSAMMRDVMADWPRDKKGRWKK